jgi:hypothetical protein
MKKKRLGGVDLLDMRVAVEVAQDIISKLPKIKPKGNWKKYCSEYCKQIHDNIEEIKTCPSLSKEEREYGLISLDDELCHVECVFNWLQENKIRLVEGAK